MCYIKSVSCGFVVHSSRLPWHRKSAMQKWRMKRKRKDKRRKDKGRMDGRKNFSWLSCWPNSTSVYIKEKKERPFTWCEFDFIEVDSERRRSLPSSGRWSACCSFMSRSINLRWDNLFHLLFYALWLLFLLLLVGKNVGFICSVKIDDQPSPAFTYTVHFWVLSSVICRSQTYCAALSPEKIAGGNRLPKVLNYLPATAA